MKKMKALKTVTAVLAVVCLIANVAMHMLSTTMDTFLGRGERTVTVAEEAANWDTEYYKTDYKTPEEAREGAYEVAQKIVDEGVVLLKNNGALPLEKGSTVTPFGYRYLEPIYGQLTSGGSAKWMVGNEITPAAGLQTELTVNEAAVKKMEAASPIPLKEAEGTIAASGESSILGGDSLIYEYDPAIYTGLSGKGGTGLVFIARAGQEDYDLKSDGYEDGTPHYLALSENEKGAIAEAKQYCDKVVLIIESSAPMELGEVMEGEYEVDAILWVGHVGERGYARLGKILTGEVNPSGRTVDIFPADFTADPTYIDNGDFQYDNATATVYGLGSGSTIQRSYVEYQEGVYMGYRYYETADELGVLEYDTAVVFPFGYGLSYTTFAQKIVDFDDSGDTIHLTVSVTNTGAYAGKDTVQVYYSSPYTDFDAENKIEKPSVVLAAFAKTDLIPAGGEATVELSFDKSDMASYCYSIGEGGYVLEAGEYAITLRTDSHHVMESRTVQVEETLWYDEAHNLFPDSTAYMERQSQLLTRADWENTYPSQPESHTKSADETTLSLLGMDNYFDWENDPLMGNKAVDADMPTGNAQNGLTLINLRGADYDDPRWELLLDEINWDNIEDIMAGLCACAYNTPQLEDIGLPSTVAEDGVSGIKVQGIDSGYDMTKTATFGMAPLLASTWNVELAEEMGEALGQEGLLNGVQGLYAPAVNLHRSPFGGRVFEYFSEDPLLSGKMAAAEISGAGKYGLTCYLKHFAVNDQETNRSKLISVWADEQTMRELYFKPFEIAVKEAKCEISYIADDAGTVATKEINACTGIMTTQANIGGVPGHANYALITELLRGEWGFEGVVSTDYWFWSASGKNAKLANTIRDATFRAGSDVYLCMGMPNISVNDKTSATALAAYRENIKHLAFAVVNSAAMQGISAGATVHYAISPWRIYLYVFDGVILLLLLATGVIVWREKRKQA